MGGTDVATREEVADPDPDGAGGAYLTDGRRLAQMIGADIAGNFHLEDCSGPAGENAELITLTHSELTENWKVVDRG